MESGNMEGVKNQKFEFKVNEYLTLKLEKGKINIYVKGNPFTQCKFLLVNIPVKKIEEFDNIESIDEAAEKLDSSMERSGGNNPLISPKEEFWSHCRYIHVFVFHSSAPTFYSSRGFRGSIRV